jgi:hypothetical protein
MRDLRIIRWGYPYLILWMSAIHIVIGVALLQEPRTENLLIISGLNRFAELPVVDRHILAYALVGSALLACIGLVLEDRLRPKVCLGLLIWQYGLVFGSFLSDFIVLWNGVNPANGADVSRWLLLVVLAPILLAGPLHTLSIIERFVVEPRRGPEPG